MAPLPPKPRGAGDEERTVDVSLAEEGQGLMRVADARPRRRANELPLEVRAGEIGDVGAIEEEVIAVATGGHEQVASIGQRRDPDDAGLAPIPAWGENLLVRTGCSGSLTS
jgi:hypothetical protein